MTQQAYKGHTGPYIVTTYRNGPWPHTTNQRDILSRRAVVTLEEARLGVRTIIVDAALALGTTQDFPPAHLSSWAEDVITEYGGMVGPLPDGTVIEVEKTTYVHLACDGDWEWPEDDTDYSSPARHSTEVLAAYNANQESARA